MDTTNPDARAQLWLAVRADDLRDAEERTDMMLSLARMARVLLVMGALSVCAIFGGAAAEAAAPPDYPVPIGPAPYAGDLRAGWFMARDVDVRFIPSAEGSLIARGQPWHTMGVRCTKAGQHVDESRNSAWYYISFRHFEARHTYDDWVYSADVYAGGEVPRCPAGI